MTRGGYVLLLLLLMGLAALVPMLRLDPARPPSGIGAGLKSPLAGVTLDRIATPSGPRLIVTSVRGTDPLTGLAVGDRILDLDGVPIVSLASLRSDLNQDRSNPLRLHVNRDGKTMAVVVRREHKRKHGRWS